MDDPGAHLIDALDQLAEVADAVTSDDAYEEFDDATLQEFWREWPRLSSWAGALWRRLNNDLEASAQPVDGPDHDEVGGSG